MWFFFILILFLMYKINWALNCPGAQGYYSHPQDCQKFMYCSNYKMLYEYKCGPGSFFNPKIQVCDWKENVVCKISCETKSKNNCTSSISTTSTTSTTSSTTTTSTTPLTTTTSSTSPKTTTFSSSFTTKFSNITNILTTVNLEAWTWTTKKDEWHPTIGPTTTPEPNPNEEFDDNYKIVCYFTNWAWYRPSLGKYIPEDVNAKYCTHINYAFAVLDSNSLTIKVHDSWADIENQFLRRVVSLKRFNARLKVLLALGGWNDSRGDKYSKLVNDQEKRQKFIKSVLDFLIKYKFDGLDLDWEYPKCWQTNCKKGPKSDKEAFANLVKELKAAFKKKNLLLTAAVSPSKQIIDQGYDVPVLAQYLDFINLMAYDYHGSWENFASHHSPIYMRHQSKSFDSNDHEFNLNASVTYWKIKGMPSQKIIVGVPFYGRSFQLEKTANSYKTLGFGEKATNGGNPGPYSREKGYLAYYEICDFIKNKSWIKHRDSFSELTFATHNDQWVGYDDPQAIRKKSEFIINHQLGGAMVWAIDLDDYRGKCCNVRYPLLKTLNSKLRKITSFLNIQCY